MVIPGIFPDFFELSLNIPAARSKQGQVNVTIGTTTGIVSYHVIHVVVHDDGPGGNLPPYFMYELQTVHQATIEIYPVDITQHDRVVYQYTTPLAIDPEGDDLECYFNESDIPEGIDLIKN